MFLQTHRQPSIGCSCILHFLFLLHICTAFVTIIAAFNHNLESNEAIIQLSTDSIHVIKSQTNNGEMKDSEEKELLMVLLKSYDDELKLNTQINDEISNIERSSSIRFIPSSLHFSEQPIAIPRMQTIMIINDDSEPLVLYSLSGITNEFYSSSFQQTLLSPYGGNTSIHIYYLPRRIGRIKTVFTIKTNQGNIYYDVHGQSQENPFRLRPIVNATIPVNSPFEYTIQFYNPYNTSLDIHEIYTSDENLIIELLLNRNIKNKITKTFEHHEQWHVKPYEVKPIIKLNYFTSKLHHLRGFVCIKTNFTGLIIVPVEINVLNRSGLYSNVDLLEFTTHKSIRSIADPIILPIYVFNNGRDPVMITEVRVPQEHSNYITTQYKTLPIPPDILRLNRIAEITINPKLIPSHIQHLQGSVQVHNILNNEESILEIPFDEIVLHGAVDYQKENTLFYIPSSFENQSIEGCTPIRLLNRFTIPLSVYNITVNNAQFLSQFIQIEYSPLFLFLYPNQWSEILCITLRKQPVIPFSFTALQNMVDIHTNLSHFHFPIYLYNGFLTLHVLTDYTNSGIRQNETNPMELSLTSISVNKSYTVAFILINTNPIGIEIEKFSITMPNTDIELDYMEALNGNKTKIKTTNTYKNNLIPRLILPEQHRAIFLLTINGTNPPGFHNEFITFVTRYQSLNINIKYQVIDGSLEFTNEKPLHIDVLPNHMETVDLFVHNKFNAPINVLRMDFITYGICFSFVWLESAKGQVKLQPNKLQRLGKLNFDVTPLCKTVQLLSESTCYCGFHHHSEFKQRWDDHVLAMNTYGVDYTLVNKFRNLWKEWTSLVRKQRIETNIWLYTDQANISLPVTIAFVWPSVLEQMSSILSRAPLILDFQVIFVNITKTQEIVITNPSSDLLTYSIEFLYNYSDNSKSVIDDQIFTISTPSRPTELINGIYKFQLQPNELMSFIVSYHPTSIAKHEMYFIVRNNLTIIESMLIRGQGGIGSLQVGHRPAGLPITPIMLTIDENQHLLCSNINGNPLLRKILTLYNTGNMRTIIYDISFDRFKCSGHGFSAPNCINIEIEPNEKYNLQILFQPDYTVEVVNKTFTLNTNIGQMSFPLIVRIPQHILSACYRIVPRPPWELRTYYLSLCLLAIILVLIFFTAGYDARRIFEDYLTRAEWCERIVTTNNKIFDLSDLSSAVQDEQKMRERLESNSAIDITKEKSIETPKNEARRKRSTTPINENRETPLKVRTSTGSTTSVRSTGSTSKPISQKERRATTDSRPTKPSKPQPLQSRKSDQRTPPTVSKVVSSSNVSDEENEPFVVARSRRTSTKTKESSTNSNVKSTTDSTIPVKAKSSLHADQSDLSKLDASSNDQNWQMVSSSKGQRKGNTLRREVSNESQTTNKNVKASSVTSGNVITPPSASNTRSSTSNKSRQSRHRPTHQPLPAPVPNLTKRKSLQENTPLFATDRELTFRQLTEQLWAAGLPSATTGCSMSIRSRCSSAPPSERGGGDDDTSRTDWNDDDKEENIDWDEPNAPDDDFGRYALQSESSMNKSNETHERSPTSPRKTTPTNIPALMSLSITPPIMIQTNLQQKSTTSTSVIKENIEPLPFPQYSPGPIQRPNKLSCQPTAQSSFFPIDSTQSPNTPDVLVQINHLLDHQNSITTIPSTVNTSNSSTVIQDISTPNVPWTPFAPTEWSSKYDSSWPMTNIQSPNGLLTTQIQNPFAQQQQIAKEESTVWPTALGTATPRSTPLTSNTQSGAEWNELFSSTVPSSIESAKPSNNSWSKFLPVPESPSSPSQQENETNNPFWNSMELNETQPNASTSWWPKPSSNNNNNDKDQSRWDFAR